LRGCGKHARIPFDTAIARRDRRRIRDYIESAAAASGATGRSVRAGHLRHVGDETTPVRGRDNDVEALDHILREHARVVRRCVPTVSIFVATLRVAGPG
jgi:hypothetical protein